MSATTLGSTLFPKIEVSSFFANNTIVKLAQKRIGELDEIERNPDAKIKKDYFDAHVNYLDALSKEQARVKDEVKTNNTFLGRVRRVALNGFSKIRLCWTNSQTETVIREYKIRVEAFRYRTGLNSKVAKDQVSEDLVNRLAVEVIKFKKKNMYAEWQKNGLTDHDKKQIRKLAQYEATTRILLEDSALLEQNFKFTIRCLYSVSCFMRFRATSQQLYDDRIAQQLNDWHGVKLVKRIKETNTLGVRFDHENRFVDILREKSVNVTATEVASLKDIFTDFRKQVDRHGEYSVARTGIKKWKINKTWKDFITKENGSLDQLPKSFVDIVKYDELKKLFPKLTYGETIVSFSGSQEYEGDNIDGSHGFVRVRRPCGNGEYEVFSFGVYADEWPPRGWRFLLYMGDTVPANWCFPDPNSKYPHRVIAETIRIIKEDDVEGHAQFNKDLIATLFDPTLVFQFCGRNCAYEAEKLAMAVPEPSLILTRIDHVETPKPFWLWTVPYHWAPEMLKWAVLQVVVFTLGGSRTLHGKNLFNAEVANSACFHYPKRIRELVEDEGMDGLVMGGHVRDLEAVPA